MSPRVDAREPRRRAVEASLQATRAGPPLYERLGFVGMWELRR